MSILAISFHHCTEGPSHCDRVSIREDRKIGKEKTMLSLFISDVIVYMENPNGPPKKLLNSQVSKVTRYKIDLIYDYFTLWKKYFHCVGFNPAYHQWYWYSLEDLCDLHFSFLFLVKSLIKPLNSTILWLFRQTAMNELKHFGHNCTEEVCKIFN